MDEEEKQAGFYKVAVAIVAALLTAAIGQGVLVWRDASVLSFRVEELRSAVGANTETLRIIAGIANANAIHRQEHERNAEYWIKQIQENENDIHQLQQNANARKEPFTGSEGREHE